MMNLRGIVLATSLAMTAVLPVAMSETAIAASADDLHHDGDQALRTLIKLNPTAAAIAQKARAVLIFPNIVKAGLVFGAGYGEGVLQQGEKVDGYYNSFTGSWGLQAGAQSYAYVVFLMSAKAVSYIHRTAGWEIGVSPDGGRGERGYSPRTLSDLDAEGRRVCVHLRSAGADGRDQASKARRSPGSSSIGEGMRHDDIDQG